MAQVVSLRSSSRRPRVGAAYKLWGKVKPAGTGELVNLQRLSGGRWRTLATATLRQQSLPGGAAVGYAFARKATRGTSKFRRRAARARPAVGNITVAGRRTAPLLSFAP